MSGKGELFYAPGAKKSVHIVNGEVSQTSPGVLRLSDLQGQEEGSPVESKVSKVVSKARDEFAQLFNDLVGPLESETHARFPPPPQESYTSRRHEVRGEDKLSWWNGGLKRDDAVWYRNSLFQDEPWHHKMMYKTHQLGCESQSTPWETNDRVVLNSESKERFVKPEVDYLTLFKRSRPADTFSVGMEDPPPEEPGKERLDKLRQAFQEELSHLHRIDLAPEYISEYDATFKDPKVTAIAASQGESEQPHESNQLSEYSRAYGKPIPFEPVSQMPAGIPSTRPTTQLHVASESPTTYPLSEYKAAFQAKEKLEKLAQERAALLQTQQQERAERERRRLEDLDNAALDESGKSRKNKNYGSLSTEYNDRFCEPEGGKGKLSKGFISSPKTKRIHTQAPLVTEYGVEFDHLTPQWELDKKKETLEPIDASDMKRGFVTEYEGSFCGFDRSQAEKLMEQEIEEMRKRDALKPAYSLKPTQAGHKHHLFDAEINPGYVPKTEYMRTFKNPVTKETRTQAKSFLDTMHLKDAKRSQQEVDAIEKKREKEENSKREEEEKKKPSHEELLAKESERNLLWWRNSGYRLWTTLNPITQNVRYASAERLFKTPKTEYQSAFA